MGAFLKHHLLTVAGPTHTYSITACYATRIFRGITLQTCAVHLVVPHATMLCRRVFKMANLTLTNPSIHPDLSSNEFDHRINMLQCRQLITEDEQPYRFPIRPHATMKLCYRIQNYAIQDEQQYQFPTGDRRCVTVSHYRRTDKVFKIAFF